MAVPGDAVRLVEAWCEAKTPPDVRDRARLEAEVSGNRITIVEGTVMGPDENWLRVASAQLRYDPFTSIWSLYWIDSHDRWHIVAATPTFDLEELLEVVDKDPDRLFFG